MDKDFEAKVRADFESQYPRESEALSTRNNFSGGSYLAALGKFRVWEAAAELYSDEAWNPNMDEAPRDGQAFRVWVFEPPNEEGAIDYETRGYISRDGQMRYWERPEHVIDNAVAWRLAAKGPQS